MTKQEILKKLSAIKALIPAEEWPSATEKAQSDYLVEFLKANIGKSNSLFFRTTVFDAAVKHITAAHTQLTNYKTSKTASQLVAYYTSLTSAIIQIPTPLRGTRDKQKDTISSVAQYADTIIDGLKQKQAIVIESLESIEADIEAINSSFSKKITAREEQLADFKVENKALMETQTLALVAEKSEVVDKKISEFEDQIASTLANIVGRTEKVAEEDKNSREKLKALREKKFDEASNETEEILGLLRESLAESEQKLNGINQNYGLSGEKVLTGTYASQKVIEGKQANMWRWIGFGALCISVIAAVFLNFEILREGENWRLGLRSYNTGWGYLSKYGVILTLLLPGLFALREASGHRERANRYVQLEAQLAALDPFIESFEFKEDFKSELKESFFPGYPSQQTTKKARKRKALFGQISSQKSDIEALRSEVAATGKQLSEAVSDLVDAKKVIAKLSDDIQGLQL